MLNDELEILQMSENIIQKKSFEFAIQIVETYLVPEKRE